MTSRSHSSWEDFSWDDKSGRVWTKVEEELGKSVHDEEDCGKEFFLRESKKIAMNKNNKVSIMKPMY